MLDTGTSNSADILPEYRQPCRNLANLWKLLEFLGGGGGQGNFLSSKTERKVLEQSSSNFSVPKNRMENVFNAESYSVGLSESPKLWGPQVRTIFLAAQITPGTMRAWGALSFEILASFNNLDVFEPSSIINYLASQFPSHSQKSL